MWGIPQMNPGPLCIRCGMFPQTGLTGLCNACETEKKAGEAELQEVVQGNLRLFEQQTCRWCHGTKVYQSIFPESRPQPCKECS